MWGLLAGAGLHAQDGPKPYPIYTADHLAGTMETLGPNFAAAVRALEAGDYPAAKERLARAREQLATTITPSGGSTSGADGIGFVRTAVGAMDDFDAAMSVDVVDAEAASRFRRRRAGDLQRLPRGSIASPTRRAVSRLQAGALEP